MSLPTKSHCCFHQFTEDLPQLPWLLLDRSGMKEEPLIQMDPYVFEEAYINKMYLNYSSLDFL